MGTEPGQDQLRSALRSLRRARDGRILGGVCAGIGPRLQVDPVVLRVVLVILALFGGVGALLYAAGWLLVPEEGEDLSFLEQQLGRRRNGAPDTAIVVGGLVILGLVVFSVPWWGFPWHVPVLLVLSVLGLVALVRRDAGQGGDASPSDRPGPGEPDSSGGMLPPSGFGDPDGQGGLGGPGGLSGSAATDGSIRPASTSPAGSAWDDTRPLDIDQAGTSVPTSSVPTADAPTGSWRDAEPAPASFWEQSDPLGLELQDVELAAPPADWTPPAPTQPHPQRPATGRPPVTTSGADAGTRHRSWLFGGTMAAALLLVVAIAFLYRDSDVPLGAYIAGPLGVVGIGLIIGTWVGRTRALIAAGVLLAVALPPVSAADRWSGGVVELTAQPASVAGIQRSYDYGVADMLLDFRNVRFEDGKRVITSIDVGVGDVRIVVPPEVDVTFRGD
ncbi:MAG: PspC domain-containing protein, partial [Actinopolymorphaceae bacterium]